MELTPTSGCVVGRGVENKGNISVPKASCVSHFVLLESLAVNNCDLDCPHTGDSIENEGIPPKSLVQHILAVLSVGEGPWKLSIFIPDTICLFDIIFLHQHGLLSVGDQPICHLASEVSCRVIREASLSS